MNLQIILLVVALCLTFLCLTDGVPARTKVTDEPSLSSKDFTVYYSPEEDEFIKNEAQAQTKLNGRISWTQVAKLHECKFKTNASGFEKKRSANNLRHHFRHLKLSLPILETRKTLHRHAYTEQEEDFINKELLNHSFGSRSLYDDGIWGAILKKHNLKREQNCEGFSRERSSGGLRFHFMRAMRHGKQVPKEIKARFSRYFQNFEEGTSECNVNYDAEVQPDHGTDPGEDVPLAQQEAGEEYYVFEDIMKDLENSQNIVDGKGIDHRLFVERVPPSTDWQNDI